jgi:DNA primase
MEQVDRVKFLMREEAPLDCGQGAPTLQASTFGLVPVEGFMDAAKLEESGCRSVDAFMGAHITPERIERLERIHSRIRFPRIVFSLDRDQSGPFFAERLTKQSELRVGPFQEFPSMELMSVFFLSGLAG